MKPKQLAVIGCGLRAEGYLLEMGLGRTGCDVQLAALADPNQPNRDYYAQQYAQDPTTVKLFDTGPQLLDALGEQLDGVIIASPNTFHREALVPSLQLGLTVLLEKPVATTAEDCAAMWQAHHEYPEAPLMIGFVLRFSPFYRRIKQLIDGGTVGQTLAITATEEMNASLSSVFVRDWRRNRDLAGPLMLEKCAHDMDILNWLIGDQVTRVASFSRRTHLTPRPGAAMHCTDCQFQTTCRYSPQNLDPYVIDPTQAERYRGDYGPSNDLCVFNQEKDVPDHQIVNLEYSSGVLANFAVVMDQPINTRTIKIMGTDAQIIGDVRRNQLTVISHAKSRREDVRMEQIEVTRDDSGHDGADSGISSHFQNMMLGYPTGDWPTLRDGIDAGLVALAAEDSATTGQAINMSSVFCDVYGMTPTPQLEVHK